MNKNDEIKEESLKTVKEPIVRKQTEGNPEDEVDEQNVLIVMPTIDEIPEIDEEPEPEAKEWEAPIKKAIDDHVADKHAE